MSAQAPSGLLRLEGLQRCFGPKQAAVAMAVDNLSLELPAGAFFCLLGPSGCGKTTLLRLLGGYLQPDAGRIFIGDEELTHAPPERRGIGMVFQSYALFPHLSARDNVAFGLQARRVPRAERARRVEEMLDRVGLSADERDRRPRELSGGQQQRVALARALVIAPRLLLLDEPFANLDRYLRELLRGELKDLQRRTGVTTLLVTHDQDEALSLADQVGLMLNGRLLQVDTPERLYQRPRTPCAARLLGAANLLQVERCTANSLHLTGGLSVARGGLPELVPGTWLLCRPESCLVGAAAAASPGARAARVTSVSFLGTDRVLTVELAPNLMLRVRGRPDAVPEVALGELVPVFIPPSSLWAIPEADPPWAAESARAGGPK